MRVRVLGVLASVAAGLMLFGSATEMRADTTIFSNFGPPQVYQGNSWWDVGLTSQGAQVVAFPFVATETAQLTGASLALAALSGVTPLNVFIDSNAGGTPGSVLALLPQSGTYSDYPTTTIVNFQCGPGCATLDAGTTYWIVAQNMDPGNTAYWMQSFNNTGTWYYNDMDSTTGPWTVATAGNTFSAFDVTGVPSTAVPPVPEPGTLALLALGLVGVLALERRRTLKALRRA